MPDMLEEPGIEIEIFGELSGPLRNTLAAPKRCDGAGADRADRLFSATECRDSHGLHTRLHTLTPCVFPPPSVANTPPLPHGAASDETAEFAASLGMPLKHHTNAGVGGTRTHLSSSTFAAFRRPACCLSLWFPPPVSRQLFSVRCLPRWFPPPCSRRLLLPFLAFPPPFSA